MTLTLTLSSSNIYLGETFTSYVSVHNDSAETCQRVQLRCDLQTGTQRIPLYPFPAGVAAAATAEVVDDFLPGSSIDNVLNHEVGSVVHAFVVVTVLAPAGEGAGRAHLGVRGHLLVVVRPAAAEAVVPQVLQVPGDEAPGRQDQVLQRGGEVLQTRVVFAL
jgi:hypothetical protein